MDLLCFTPLYFLAALAVRAFLGEAAMWALCAATVAVVFLGVI